MVFHKKLYQLRKNNGLSQEELGDKLNVSRQTISKWELGESTPDMEKLIMLSDYFHISLDELILGNENIPNNENPQSHIIIEKILTEENKNKAKKGFKILGYIVAVLVIIDVLSLIIYGIMRFFT